MVNQFKAFYVHPEITAEGSFLLTFMHNSLSFLSRNSLTRFINPFFVLLNAKSVKKMLQSRWSILDESFFYNSCTVLKVRMRIEVTRFRGQFRNSANLQIARYIYMCKRIILVCIKSNTASAIHVKYALWREKC